MRRGAFKGTDCSPWPGQFVAACCTESHRNPVSCQNFNALNIYVLRYLDEAGFTLISYCSNYTIAVLARPSSSSAFATATRRRRRPETIGFQASVRSRPRRSRSMIAAGRIDCRDSPAVRSGRGEGIQIFQAQFPSGRSHLQASFAQLRLPKEGGICYICFPSPNLAPSDAQLCVAASAEARIPILPIANCFKDAAFPQKRSHAWPRRAIVSAVSPIEVPNADASVDVGELNQFFPLSHSYFFGRRERENRAIAEV